jgi:hypothetical protein
MPTTIRPAPPSAHGKRNKARPATPDRDRSLDRTIESTFPASDAPSTIPDPEPKAPRNDDSEKEA